MNTKVSSIISVCAVLNVNTDVMLENANTRKIYAVSLKTLIWRYFIKEESYGLPPTLKRLRYYAAQGAVA